MDDDHHDYYRQRSACERRIATTCDNAVVAEIHLQLAEAYEAKLMAAEIPFQPQAFTLPVAPQP